jgi:DcuC family C4-dicarboxylate transporter
LPVPERWLVDVAKEKSGVFDSRLIGAAMLVGVVAAALTARKSFKDSARSFFEGAGYGFTYIIGLIVAASCFGDGIKLIGLNQVLGQVIVKYPSLLIPLAAIIPLCFGLLSGSGMAATQSLFEFFVEPCRLTGADPFHVGAVVSLGAAAGRTISPVAAVTLMCSNMTDTNPFALSRRVAIPALIGLTVVVILAMLI